MRLRINLSPSESSRTNCLVCAGIARIMLHKGDLNLFACEQCSLVFLHPLPDRAIRDRYLYEHDLAAHFAPWHPRKRVLFGRRLGQFSSPGGGQRMCDVGCADGQFLALARSAGWDCFGVELNPPAAARAQSLGLNVVQGALEDLPDLPWGTFDVVTSWDALEHVPAPDLFVERMIQLARPGGRIVVTTLNIDSLAFRVFRHCWSMIGDEHFTYWNVRSLSQLFTSQRARVVRTESFGLGRDFVRPLDTAQAGMRKARRTARPVRATVHDVPQSWDVRSSVLLAERTINALLSPVHAGVDIMCVAERPSPDGA